MYPAGVSVRGVEGITQALWGARVSPGTVSNLNKNIYAKIEEWRQRPIEGEHPYLYLDGIVMKRTWAGAVRNVSLLVASAVNADGCREIPRICEGAKEDKSGWSSFPRHLVDRGPGPQGRAADHRRRPPGACGEHWRLSARCPMAALHGAFPPRCVRPCVVHQSARYHAGDPCAGEPERGSEEGRCGDRGPAAQRLTKAADLIEVEDSIGETPTYHGFSDTVWSWIDTGAFMEQRGFFALSEHLARLSEDGDPLDVLAATVDFEYFRGWLVEGLGYGDGRKGGRPPFDPVSMFKALILQAQHNLSDARMEFMIRDRLSWMRFLGFDLGGPTPDE